MKTSIDFESFVVDGLITHCEKWKFDRIEKLMENPTISKFMELFCRITKTYYIFDKENEDDYYSAEFSKDGTATVKKCGMDYLKKDNEYIIQIQDIIDILKEKYESDNEKEIFMSNNRREKKLTANSLKQIAGQLNTEGVPKILKMETLIDYPDNEYVFGMEESDIVNMADGIKQNGFRGAIEVWDLKNGTYMIYSGHVRKEGVKRNGGTEIRCFVYEYPEKEATRRRLFIGANIYGRNKLDINDPIHTARQIAYHRETLEMEGIKKDLRSVLATEFGISGSNIQRYESILNLTPEIQKKTEDGELPITVAAAMGSMDEKMQEETVRAIEELKEELGEDSVTRNDMTNIVSEVKKTGDVESAVNKVKEKATQKEERRELEAAVPPKKEAWQPEIEEDDDIIYNYEDDDSEETDEHDDYYDKIILEAAKKMVDALTSNYQYTNTEKVLEELENMKALIEKEISRLHEF